MQSVSMPGQSVAELITDDRRASEHVRLLPVAPGWTNVADVLQQDETHHPAVTTAVIGAIAAPKASSLESMLTALETAVAENDLGPQRLLAALIQRLLPRQSGRILLITYDPRSITHPMMAAARGSARGIFTYMESLRPALKLRGISAGMLLLTPKNHHDENLAANASLVAKAAAECLQNATLQRTLKLR